MEYQIFGSKCRENPMPPFKAGERVYLSYEELSPAYIALDYQIACRFATLGAETLFLHNKLNPIALEAVQTFRGICKSRNIKYPNSIIVDPVKHIDAVKYKNTQVLVMPNYLVGSIYGIEEIINDTTIVILVGITTYMVQYLDGFRKLNIQDSFGYRNNDTFKNLPKMYAKEESFLLSDNNEACYQIAGVKSISADGFFIPDIDYIHRVS